MTFATEITVDVTVNVLDATREVPGRYGDCPERCYPTEHESVDVSVMLGAIDITGGLPSDVLEALASEALERLHEV